jgi:hypothetical protein
VFGSRRMWRQISRAAAGCGGDLCESAQYNVARCIRRSSKQSLCDLRNLRVTLDMTHVMQSRRCS